MLGGLFDDDEYLENDLRFRLAFREFGTCIGIGCAFNSDDKDGEAAHLKARSEEIITQWQKYISITPEDLKPITKIMFSTALITGGKWNNYGQLHLISIFYEAD